jgi:hypothetical protein
MAAAESEMALRIMLTGPLDTQYGDVVPAGQPLANLIDNCQALIPLHSELTAEQRSTARELLTTVKPLSETRNDLVHGLLAVSGADAPPEQPPKITALVSTWRRPGPSRTLTLEEIHQTTQELRSITRDMIEWTFAHVRPQQQVHPLS